MTPLRTPLSEFEEGLDDEDPSISSFEERGDFENACDVDEIIQEDTLEDSSKEF